ncbi:MAG: hypothetical protein IK149_01730 [Oscillospiraceae bacterium]|nr:hypothetical protein [Oscillospiraceae bacterium]
MEERIWLVDLQFFAGEGASGGGEGGGEGAAPGVEAASRGQDELEQLGVPKSEAEKYGAKMRRRAAAESGTIRTEKPAPEPAKQPEGQAPAAEAKPEEKPARKTLAEMVKTDPELNRELQAMFSERVKGYAQARDQLKEIQPMLATIAAHYKMDVSDPGKIDLKELAKNIERDDSYWEETANEYGVTPDVARKIKGYEQLKAQEEAKERETLEEQQFRAHIGKLVQQETEMKKIFPDFSLRKELNDPNFRRLTSPSVGLSVKDAFYAIHHEELRRVENEVIARRAQEALANSVAAGARRPKEGGSAQAASTGDMRKTSFSRADIERIKREGERAHAEGRKYYIDR